ncbi:MAG: hypothetical protein Q9174_005958 [Haloplaca sp. 1 TL-2023]
MVVDYVMYLNPFHYILLIILLPFSTLAQAPGDFTLYLDAECSSSCRWGSYTTNPNVCLLVSGARAVSNFPSPLCASYQTAQLLWYPGSSCNGKSYYFFPDFQSECHTVVDDALGAIQFGCGDAGGNDVATSTRRIRVVAYTSTSTAIDAASEVSRGDSGRPSPNDYDDDGASIIASRTAVSRTTTSTATGATSKILRTESGKPSSDSGDKDASTTSSRIAGSPTPTSTPVSDDDQRNDSVSDGLGGEAKVALGIGIGIGVPSLVLAFLAWWFPRKRKKFLGK